MLIPECGLTRANTPTIAVMTPAIPAHWILLIPPIILRFLRMEDVLIFIIIKNQLDNAIGSYSMLKVASRT
jgi:hypothetical protein